jgi:large subunit ribosomal protein L9
VEVILLEKIRNLGALGDKVRVKPGFARNYLIPESKAVYANEANIAKFEQRRAELEKAAALRQQKALDQQQAIQALPPITLTVKASEEGKLFGSIGTRDIVAELEKLGTVVEKRAIRLPEGTLRMVGDYNVEIDLDSDVTAIVKVNIVAEG